jgi:hypothetical protein
MTNNIPYLRKNTLTLFVSSAVIALLLMSSSLLPLSNLPQPAQATSNVPISIETRNPVDLRKLCSHANVTLNFEAKGNGQTLTNGTFQITNRSSGQILWSGDLYSLNILEMGFVLDYEVDSPNPVCGSGSGHVLEIQTDCGYGVIELSADAGNIGNAIGMVNCEFPSDTTAQQSSPTMTATTTTQDSEDGVSRDGDGDRDGIPDSGDRCIHNSNTKCFKEGEASTTTTTTQQQPSPSSSGTGNQTR